MFAIPSSLSDSIDIVLFLKLRESVDWERILRSPRGASSFRDLQHTHACRYYWCLTIVHEINVAANKLENQTELNVKIIRGTLNSGV